MYKRELSDTVISHIVPKYEETYKIALVALTTSLDKCFIICFETLWVTKQLKRQYVNFFFAVPAISDNSKEYLSHGF